MNAQSVEWIKQVGGAGMINEDVRGVCDDASGNIYITGCIGQGSMVDGHALTVHGVRDIFLAKFSAEGSYLWAVRAGGTPNGTPDLNEGDFGWEVAYDSISEAIYVCGSYHGYSFPATFEPGISVTGRGAFLAKYDLEGNCIWMRASYNGAAHSMAFDEVGNVFVTGYSDYSYFMDSTSFIGPPEITIANGPFMAKYTSAGDLLWAKSMGSQIDGSIRYRNGSIYFGGGTGTTSGTLLSETVTTTGLWTGFLASIDSACTVVNWLQQLDSDGAASILDIQLAQNGDVLVAGAFKDNLFLPNDTLHGPFGNNTMWVAKFDSLGNALWANAFPVSNSFGSTVQVSMAPDGSIYTELTFSGTLTAGSELITAASDMDLAVVRVSTSGEVLGVVHAGEVSNGRSDVLATSDNGCCIAFPFDSTIDLGDGLTSMGARDMFLAKLGIITWVPPSMVQPGNGLLIYANPSNGLCTIELPDALRITEDLALSVFDSKGRLVQQVPLAFGDRGLRLDIRAQAKGVYRVELSDGEQHYSGSIVFE